MRGVRGLEILVYHNSATGMNTEKGNNMITMKALQHYLYNSRWDDWDEIRTAQA